MWIKSFFSPHPFFEVLSVFSSVLQADGMILFQFMQLRLFTLTGGKNKNVFGVDETAYFFFFCA